MSISKRSELCSLSQQAFTTELLLLCVKDGIGVLKSLVVSNSALFFVPPAAAAGTSKAWSSDPGAHMLCCCATGTVALQRESALCCCCPETGLPSCTEMSERLHLPRAPFSEGFTTVDCVMHG